MGEASRDGFNELGRVQLKIELGRPQQPTIANGRLYLRGLQSTHGLFTAKRLYSKAQGRGHRGAAVVGRAPWVEFPTKPVRRRRSTRMSTPSNPLYNAFGVTDECKTRTQGGAPPLRGSADPGLWNITPSA